MTEQTDDRSDRARSIASLAFLAMIALFCVCLICALSSSLDLSGIRSFRMFRSRVIKELGCGMLFKNRFVDVNGAYRRLSGFRMCNQRMRYRDGTLGYPYEDFCGDIGMAAGKLRAVASECSRRHVPFVLAIPPCRLDIDGSMLPDGWTAGNPNRDAKELVDMLAGEGVRTLDMITAFASSPEVVAASFFETDHHWRFESALAAAGMLVDELSDVCADEAADARRCLDEENWEWADVGRVFLGAHGRRVGRFFGGLSEFRYCTPRFETSISVCWPSKGRSVCGSFEEVMLDRRVLMVQDPYAVNMYALYGSNDVLTVYENARAPCGRRVMIIKDSFGNPVTAFLATVFGSIVEVDPRFVSKDETISNLLDRYRPDAVVLTFNSGMVFSKMMREWIP